MEDIISKSFGHKLNIFSFEHNSNDEKGKQHQETKFFLVNTIRRSIERWNAKLGQCLIIITAEKEQLVNRQCIKNGNETFNRGGKRILETNSGQISQPIAADGNTNS